MEFITALLWWPVITYILGVVVFQAAAIHVWRTDDHVKISKSLVMAFIWPRFIPELLR